jgi:hypothetical protein
MLPIIGESKKIANIIHEEKVYVDKDHYWGVKEKKNSPLVGVLSLAGRALPLWYCSYQSFHYLLFSFFF